MGKLTEYVTDQAKKKKQTPAVWLAATLSKVPKISLATHVGKFTHSGTNVFVYDGKRSDIKGYVVTENAKVPEDFVYTNANIMTPAVLFQIPLEDGHSLYQHLKERDPAVLEEWAALGADPYALPDMLAGLDKGVPAASDGRLRQVYFPVGNETYHLLTLLPPSSLMEALKDRLTAMGSRRKAARDSKSETYGSDYDDLPDGVTMGIGGANPQNVSAFCNGERGNFSMLLSLPPDLIERDLHLPRRDFFTETLPWRETREEMERLVQLFRLDRNNVTIRTRIWEGVDRIIDIVVGCAARLQEQPGWTEGESYQRLPPVQKYWLDPASRSTAPVEEWEKKVGTLFGRWLVGRLNAMMKDDNIHLADVELLAFAKEMEDSLTWGGEEPA